MRGTELIEKASGRPFAFEILTANRDTDDVSVIFVNDDGTFAPALSVPVGGSQPCSVVTADPHNFDALDQVQKGARVREVKPLVARPAAVLAAVAKLYRNEPFAFAALESKGKRVRLEWRPEHTFDMERPGGLE